MCVNWFLLYYICIHTCKLIVCQNGKLILIYLINIHRTVYNEHYNFDKYVPSNIVVLCKNVLGTKYYILK